MTIFATIPTVDTWFNLLDCCSYVILGHVTEFNVKEKKRKKQRKTNNTNLDDELTDFFLIIRFFEGKKRSEYFWALHCQSNLTLTNWTAKLSIPHNLIIIICILRYLQLVN